MPWLFSTRAGLLQSDGEGNQKERDAERKGDGRCPEACRGKFGPTRLLADLDTRERNLLPHEVPDIGEDATHEASNRIVV